MASISWKTGVGGDWGTSADWSTGKVPGSADDVTIGVAGSFAVTVTVAEAAHSLTLNSSGATLTDSAALTIGTQLVLKAGTLELANGGTIVGGTIAASGGTLVGYGGTLSGVTYQGTLDLSGASERLHISNGITLTGAGGSGAGTINLTGTSGELYVTTPITLDNATINIGNSTAYDFLRLTHYGAGSGGVTTLGSHLSIVQTGAHARIDANYRYAGDALLNRGTITAGLSGASLLIYGTDSFTNAGTLIASNGGTLEIDPSGSWSSTGTISETNGTLDLGGTFSGATLSTVKRSGGYVSIISGATVTNTGNTVNLGSGTSLGQVALDGTIVGGTIHDGGGGILGSGGTLSGVVYQGTLDLSGASERLHISNGITLTGAGGSGAGTINLTGSNGELYVTTPTTLDNATINIGNSTAYDFLRLTHYGAGSGGVTTLGSHLSIVQTGAHARIDANYRYAGDALLNRGTITAGLSGASLLIYGTDSFTNAGTLIASNGGTLEIDPSGAWSSTGTISETNGTLNLGGTFSTATLNTVKRSGGYVSIISGATLTNSGTADIGSGSSVGQIALGGLISGGTIHDGGEGILGSGGTLSGVVYQGTLDLSGASERLHISNGITLTGAGGSGAGTVNLTGTSSELYVITPITLDNATINIGNSTAYDFLRLTHYGAGSGGVNTLGSHLSIVQTGAHARINANYRYAGDAVVNQGTITAGLSGASLLIYGSDRWTNAGTLIATNGGTLTFEPGSFINTGLVTASPGSTLAIEPTGSWSSTGTISETNATLDLGGTFSTATLNTIKRTGGYISIVSGGTLTNTGSTVNLGSGAALGQIVLGGLISGGTIHDGGSGLIGYGGTLSGVVYQGTLDLSGASERLHISNGITLTGAGGSGAGTLNLTGTSGELYVNTPTTLDNATINIGNSTAYDFLRLTHYGAGSGGVTTLGSHLSVVQTGAHARINADYRYAGDAVVNQGTITAGFSGASLLIYGSDRFTNAGTLIASNGGTLEIESATLTNSGTISASGSATVLLQPTTLTNLVGSTLTGGSFSAGAGSTIEFSNNVTITSDAANITLSGANSNLQSLNTTTDTQTTLDSSLATIAASGQLHLLANRNFTAVASNGSFSNSGLLDLGGGKFSATLLTNAAQGTVSGFGTVAGSIGNSGLVTASGGTLSTAGLSGIAAGTLSSGGIGAGVNSTLQLASNLTISTDAGRITLSGTGSVIQSLNTATSKQVSLDSTLATIASTGTLALLSGRSFTAVAGAGAFTDKGLLALGAGTFSATALTVSGTASGFGTIAGKLTNTGLVAASGGTLVLTGSLSGAGAVSVASGAVLSVDGGASVAGNTSIVGTLSAASAVAITGGTFTNAGTIAVADGATFGVQVGAVDTNLAGTTLTGGAWSAIAAGHGAAISLTGTSIATDAASITLSGSGSSFLVVNGSTTTTLEASLATINKGGQLNLLGGRGFASTSAKGITDNGSITLAGGSFASKSLTIGTGSTFSGSGTIANSLTNNGTLSASGGTLSVSGTVGGAGSLIVGTSASMTFGGAFAAKTATVNAAGTLTGFGTLTSNLIDSGTVIAKGGTLAVGGAVSGKGAITIDSGAAVSITGSLVSTGGLTFASGGSDLLALGTAGKSTTRLTGFGSGDTIDIVKQALASVSWTQTTGTAGALTLTGSSGAIGTLSLAGSFTQANFALKTDGAGGTDISFAATSRLAADHVWFGGLSHG